MTLHSYDMVFCELTQEGLNCLTVDDRRWKWFSLEGYERLDHIVLEEPEKTYQYGNNGLFENNVDIVKFAFLKAKELEEKGTLTINQLTSPQ